MGGAIAHEVVIAGAGIAGASLAYFLAQGGITDVLVLEREDRPGRHASGRSAEALVEVELDPVWQPLLCRGAGFLRRPPPGFAGGQAIVRATGVVNLMDGGERTALEAALPALRSRGVSAEVLEPAALRRRLPFLSEDDLAGALWLPRSGRLAVAALLGGYLEAARAAGATVWLDTEVTEVVTMGGRITGVQTTRGEIRCRTLVNAAGAWAGPLGRLAGGRPIQLEPRRRTVISFDAPEGMAADGWPLVSYDSRGIYLAPEGHGLLASPMDEDPVAACDAQPDPARVAQALERLGRLAAPLVPAEVRAARAGLRTFAPDHHPVVGDDPDRPGLFWLAGQGGWGIETSPALGQLAAALLAGQPLAPDLAEVAPACAPTRF